MPKPSDKLTPKQQAFVQAYLGQALGNAAEAARLAGYKQPHPEGPRLLQLPKIQAALALQPKTGWNIADPDEVRATLTSFLRDESARKADRLRAAEVLSKVLPGLAVPARTELSGPGGMPIQMQSVPDLSGLSDEELEKLDAIFGTTGEAP
jgi:phage terminase small subunit